MKDEILKALADKWVRESEEPEIADGSDQAAVGNAIAKGIRLGMRRCASDIERLVLLLGETK